MSVQDLRDIHEELIQEQKKLIHLEFLFPTYTMLASPGGTRRFITDPNDVVEKIFYNNRYKLKTIQVKDLLLIVSTYIEWVECLYQSVHQLYVNTVYKHWNQINGFSPTHLMESPEMEEFREWTAIYVQSCLSRFWTEHSNAIFLQQCQSDTMRLEERIPQTLRTDYQNFYNTSISHFYRLLLCVHIHPHLIMQTYSMGKTVVMNYPPHDSLNEDITGNPCVILVPCISIDFSRHTYALVHVDVNPSSTVYALPSWCGSLPSDRIPPRRVTGDIVTLDEICDCDDIRKRDRLNVDKHIDEDHPDKGVRIQEVMGDIQTEIAKVKARSQRLATLFHGYPTQKSGRFIPSHHEIASLLQNFQAQYTYVDQWLLQTYVQMIHLHYVHVVNTHVRPILQQIWDHTSLTGRPPHYQSDEVELLNFTNMYVNRALLQVWTSEFDRQWQSSLQSIFTQHKNTLSAEGRKWLDELHAVAQNSLYRVLLFTNIFAPPKHLSRPFAGQVFTYDPALHFPVNANTLGNDPPCATILATFCVNVHTTRNQSLVFIHPMDVANPCYPQTDFSSEITVSKIVELCSRRD